MAPMPDATPHSCTKEVQCTACETVAATLQRELRTTHREPTLDLARRELHSREHGGERWLHFQAAHEGEGADAEGGERVRDHAAHARL